MADCTVGLQLKNMPAPLVSILIPAFNAERWIAETIQSALNQTWWCKEIIVVDDGSTDRTLNVAREFASSVVTIATQPNQGAAAARNKAYSICQGDYIQWLDHDDLLAPDKISMQIEAAATSQSKRTLFSSAWGRFTYRPHRAVFEADGLWNDLTPREWLTRALQQGMYTQPATWLISRELASAAGPWDERLSFDDDGEYACRLVAASDYVRFVPEAKLFYRRSGAGSLSRTRSDKQLHSEFLSMTLQVQHLLSVRDDSESRAAAASFLQRYLIDFYPERGDLVEQLRQFAKSFGCELDVPKMPAKYGWIQMLFGWSAAKRAQLYYNEGKSLLLRSWDGALLRLGV